MAFLNPRPVLRRRAERGAASLIIVVILLATMAVGVAYTNRNLVFEQRTAANQYRSTIAAEAAEAGLEWALAMMNKDNTIGTACTSSTAAGSSAFRDRYFVTDDTTGAMTIRAKTNNIHVACISNPTGSGWACDCPVAGTAAAPAASAPTSGYQPSFAVVFDNNAGVNGTARVTAYGCTSPIASTACAGDSAAMATVLVGPIPVLGTPPAAPLTARGSVNFGGAVTIVNGDPSTNGITVNSGLGISEPPGQSITIETVPGTPPKATLVGNDPTLAGATEEEMFKNFFNMTKADFRALSSVKSITCSPCGASDLLAAYNSGSRAIWVNGNLDMGAQSEIGTVLKPVLIVVDGNVTINAGVEIYGMVYSTGITWNQTGGGNALVNGAAISEGSYTGNGNPAFVYDPRVLNNLRNTLGTFVRIPGSWRDYN